MLNIEIIIIALIVSSSCALCGVFLLLRKMSLMSDAISHSILIGIVLGTFISGSVTSALPVIGALVSGMLSVVLTELLHKTKLLKSDAAIGLVFPALFSIAVILVAAYAENSHIDIDTVLLGELGFAPFDRMELWGISLPKSMVTMSIVLLCDIVFIALFFKELKISAFDSQFAFASGFSPSLMHYALMLSVTVTTVGAFDAVGAVLVTALMIVPAACALLLTDNLFFMLLTAVAIGSFSSFTGYVFANIIDANIAGASATVTGILFIIVYLFSPKHGAVKRIYRRKQLQTDFALAVLTVHLSHHSANKHEADECRMEHLSEHINWSKSKAHRICSEAVHRGLIENRDGFLYILSKGQEYARRSFIR